MDELDPMAEALYRAATEGGGTAETWHADPDKSTVLLGSPGLYNGLAIARWADQ
jgi:hypothetical protein